MYELENSIQLHFSLSWDDRRVVKWSQKVALLLLLIEAFCFSEVIAQYVVAAMPYAWVSCAEVNAHRNIHSPNHHHREEILRSIRECCSLPDLVAHSHAFLQHLMNYHTQLERGN